MKKCPLCNTEDKITKIFESHTKSYLFMCKACGFVVNETMVDLISHMVIYGKELVNKYCYICGGSHYGGYEDCVEKV